MVEPILCAEMNSGITLIDTLFSRGGGPMPRDTVIKVLLIAAVPMTGLAYVAARTFVPSEPQRAVSRTSPVPVGHDVPIDLRFEEEPPSVNAMELPVHVEARPQRASQPRAEPTHPASPPLVEREVLAGPSARQSKRGFVRIWGAVRPDTSIEPGARRSASELSGHYRSEDEGPSFDRVGSPGSPAEMEADD